eukprot:g10859.t1
MFTLAARDFPKLVGSAGKQDLWVLSLALLCLGIPALCAPVVLQAVDLCSTGCVLSLSGPARFPFAGPADSSSAYSITTQTEATTAPETQSTERDSSYGYAFFWRLALALLLALGTPALVLGLTHRVHCNVAD